MKKFHLKNSMSILAGISAAALLTAILSGCNEKKNNAALSEVTDFSGHIASEVNVGYVDVTGSGKLTDTIGLARDKGFFKEEFDKIGVKINLIPMTGAGPAINEALASGDLDIGTLGDVPAVLGKASGIDTKIISFSDFAGGASLIAGKGTTYTSIADLKGKQIATQRGAFMHRTLAYLLEEAGLTFKDIEFVHANAQTAAEMLVTGNVDAAVVGGVTLARLYEQGFNIVADYRTSSQYRNAGVQIARTQYIKENPDIIKAFEVALARARLYAKENKNALLEQWTSTGESASSYEYLYPGHDNYPRLRSAPDLIANYNDVLKFLLDNDLIQQSKKFSITDWIDGRFYEYALAEVGE
ncbi:MAG: ABC transporter substrate-binding protein [Treponema sp.]|nr:ABC transporter substrate-binding protein [Treponema sp.]